MALTKKVKEYLQQRKTNKILNLAQKYSKRKIIIDGEEADKNIMRIIKEW